MKLTLENLDHLKHSVGASALETPCSNQGRPLGGWEIVWDINGVPAIVSENFLGSLQARSFHLLRVNGKLGHDDIVASYYARFLVSVLLQGDPKFYRLSPKILFDFFEWDGLNEKERWLDIGKQTIEQTLKTQEFHKEVLQRYWLNWSTVFLELFNPPVEFMIELKNIKHVVRGFKDKQEMQELYQDTCEKAAIKWLPFSI